MGEAVRRAGESLRFSEGNWALGWFAFDVELPMLELEVERALIMRKELDTA